MPDADQIALEAAREIDLELAAVNAFKLIANRTRSKAIIQTGVVKAIRQHAFELAIELSQDAAELAKRFKET